jgi:CIC family chloride channel protein
VDTDFVALAPGVTMAQMQDTVENSPGYDYFPVLDNGHKLLGVVKLEQLKPVLFDSEIAESLLVFDLMESPSCILSEDDDLLRAMSSLERHKVAFLPVNSRNGTFMGFVKDQEIFKLYRGLVRESNSF